MFRYQLPYYTALKRVKTIVLLPLIRRWLNEQNDWSRPNMVGQPDVSSTLNEIPSKAAVYLRSSCFNACWTESAIIMLD